LIEEAKHGADALVNELGDAMFFSDPERVGQIYPPLKSQPTTPLGTSAAAAGATAASHTGAVKGPAPPTSDNLKK
jgi:hypothetical protein